MSIDRCWQYFMVAHVYWRNTVIHHRNISKMRTILLAKSWGTVATSAMKQMEFKFMGSIFTCLLLRPWFVQDHDCKHRALLGRQAQLILPESWQIDSKSIRKKTIVTKKLLKNLALRRSQTLTVASYDPEIAMLASAANLTQLIRCPWARIFRIGWPVETSQLINILSELHEMKVLLPGALN